ncbi:MAG: Dyp-type peroxidase [Nitrospira sp.]|nr:MAG: Dyp-type peroxidase [Nitrospira sp.]
MDQEPVLDLDDIQGNILPGFKKDAQHFVFLRVVDAQLAKKWLRGLAPRLSSAKEVMEAHTLWKGMRRKLGRDPDNLDFLFLNCAISAEGLQKLAVPGIDEFDDAAFKLGMESRAGVIGDPPTGSGTPGATETWLFGSGRKRPDVLLILATDDDVWAARAERELITSARSNGFQRIHVDRGRVRPGAMAGHEHFGFKDGISLPAIRGRASAAAHDFVEPRVWPPSQDFNAYRSRYAAPGRQLVWPGHFVFGYPRQMRDQPEDMRPHSEPPGPTWAKNGSFLVYRRLRQDVVAFQKFLATASALIRGRGFDQNLTPERLGALLVGRWASGWPLARDPHTDRGENQAGENHFTFSETTTVPLPNDLHPLNLADPNGVVCPFAAHIRKVQPRDDSTDIGPMERTFQKLILRRGITFGRELGKSDGDRGLLFVAYQTSIVDQFEFIMNDWVNDENKPHANSGVDPIIGGARDSTILLNNGNTTFPLTVPGGWVVAAGGEYMFSPSLSFFSTV